MHTQRLILERLDDICRSLDLDSDFGEIRWDDGQLVRKCAIRAQRGDPIGWRVFMTHVNSHRDIACGFIRIFERIGWAKYSVEEKCMQLTLPPEFAQIDDAVEAQLTCFLNPSFAITDEPPRSDKVGTIMYIEEKPGLAGHARIGRVTFSATRKTIYYRGRKLQSLKGSGYKANYFDVESGLEYWISNCKKDGNDTLYPGTVEIDDDAREEYWTTIRCMPQSIHLTKFRSEGKYAKRRPS
jgi:hypothetical protein